MTNYQTPTNQKVAGELNKEVWILKTKDGKIIDKFRCKARLNLEKKKLEKSYFQELIVERDNSYSKKLKEVLNDKKSKV